MKKYSQQIIVRRAIATCTVGLLTLPYLGNGIMPQTAWANPIMAQVGSVAFTPPPPPPDRDAPGNRGGGAGRGGRACNKPLIALVPEYQQTLAQGEAITKVWGTTLAEQPTFWFNVPYTRSAIASLEFVLQDNVSPATELYRSAIVPPDAPGIVSIRLPATLPPLEVGKLYQWFFRVRLQCGSSNSATQPQNQKETVYGWVQRVSPDAAFASQLKQATPQQRAALYAQKGIWFDALTTLGELRLSNLQDPRLTADWNGLLQSVGLERLTTKPLVPCCEPSSIKFTPPTQPPHGAAPGRRRGVPSR
jgi:hypothetical protein